MDPSLTAHLPKPFPPLKPPSTPSPPKTRLHLTLTASTRLYDLSGRHPFSIIFGLARGRKHDTHPEETLYLDLKHSLLDVPFALRTGLLSIKGGDGSSDEHIAETVGMLPEGEMRGFAGIDVESREREGVPARYLKLKSLVGGAENWFSCFTLYEYVVTPESELGRLLGRVGTGAEWEIRLARPELGIGWFAFGREDGDVIREDGEPRDLTVEEMAKLPPLYHRHGTSVGRCTFKTVERLAWPPRLETKMDVIRSPSSSNEESLDSNKAGSSTYLRIAVSHDSPKPLTLQTSGQQQYLTSYTQEYNLLSDAEYWPRILDKNPPGLYSNLRIISLATKKVAFGGVPRQVCRLRDMSKPVDWRPRRESLVTILPGQQLVREVIIDAALAKLEYGEYEVRVEPLGMWWCEGELGEDEDGSGRVPQRFWRTNIPPAKVEAKSARIKVVDGKLGGLGK